MKRLLAAFIFLLASPAHADVLIENVNGITLDEDGEIENFNGLLIGDDGRIAEVYRRREKRPERVDYKYDGKGRTLIPGLIDSNVRLLPFGLARLTGDESIEARDRGKPRPEDRDLAFAKAQQALVAQGVTTVADMGTTIADWQTYRRAGDAGTLHLRIVAYAADIADMELIAGPRPTPWLYKDRLKLNGVALTLDGPLEAREAWLKTPYSDTPGKRGEPLMSETPLRNLMSRAALDNFQVAVSASGDASVEAVLSAIDELVETYAGNRRWRIEGADLIDPADAPRLGQNGIVVSMRPSRLASQSRTSDAALGPERLGGVQAWRTIGDAGAVLAAGSGTALAAPRPFEGMASAITRADAVGEPFGGWQPQERLGREEALAAYTTGAAYALLAEERLGRIAKGYRADFLIIDSDPLLATLRDLRAIRVLQTWIGGKLVYDALEREAAPPPIEGR